MARLFTGKGVSMELLREMETSPVSPPDGLGMWEGSAALHN
ncbi:MULTISPECIES: hypothetical protein [unclassified Arthrobacter]|nr:MULTISPECIES: hypothetical protein [unclassified Arthrobacter]